MSKDSDLPEIFFATHNTNKSREVGQMLSGLYLVRNLNDLNLKKEIPETGTTLEENSRIKSWYLFDNFGIDCFADDTGLEVEALNGEPGVKSARYAGKPKDDNKNVGLLLGNMQNKLNKTARFRTVITLILKGVEKQFEGIVKGRIIEKRRGNNGFGYDPVFIPDTYKLTFGEMSASQKNRISHRGKAIREMVRYLKDVSSTHE